MLRVYVKFAIKVFLVVSVCTFLDGIVGPPKAERIGFRPMSVKIEAFPVLIACVRNGLIANQAIGR